jgi:hypothetical protein
VVVADLHDSLLNRVENKCLVEVVVGGKDEAMMQPPPPW